MGVARVPRRPQKSRAQTSLEYAVIVGLFLAVSIPVWGVVRDRMDSARYDLDATLARQATRSIAQAADWVSVQGYPARRTIDVQLPESLHDVSLSGSEVLFNLTSTTSYSEIYTVSNSNLSGTIPARGGPVSLVVSAVEGIPGLVNVSVVE